MLRFLFAVLLLLAPVAAQAQCANGACTRPAARAAVFQRSISVQRSGFAGWRPGALARRVLGR